MCCRFTICLVEIQARTVSQKWGLMTCGLSRYFRQQLLPSISWVQHFSCSLCLLQWYGGYKNHFWATFSKTVRPMLSVHCHVCPVCNVRALWPNGWTNQYETWRAGMPRPSPHCVRWGPSSPSLKGAQPPTQFSAHMCCGQMAAWIKMPLGMELGLSPGDFVLHGDPAP